jgi:hypothetical protein
MSALTRRNFIERGLLGSGLLLLGGALPAGCANYRQVVRETDAAQLQFFNVKEYAVMLAAADALLPDPGPFPHHRDLGTVLKIDHELAQWDAVRSKDIPLLLQLFEHGPLLFGHGFSRFSNLGRKQQRRYLAGWGESAILLRRSGFMAFKGLVAFYYFSDPAVWPLIGYDGTWIDKFTIAPLEVEGLPA